MCSSDLFFSTVMLSDVDQKIFKKLGVNITCEPVLKK